MAGFLAALGLAGDLALAGFLAALGLAGDLAFAGDRGFLGEAAFLGDLFAGDFALGDFGLAGALRARGLAGALAFAAPAIVSSYRLWDELQIAIYKEGRNFVVREMEARSYIGESVISNIHQCIYQS